MILNEVFGSVRGPGFTGSGKGDFSAKFYIYIAASLHKSEELDEHAKEFLTNWFVDVFKNDSAKFNEALFRQAVQQGVNVRSVPMFQQRHFHFLAHYINHPPEADDDDSEAEKKEKEQYKDPHVQQYISEWLGNLIGRTNPAFIPARWKKFCGLPLTPEEEKQVNPRRRNHRY